MKIGAIIAIACLGLLTWVGPASAQKTYSLTVSRHQDVALSADDVDKILADASKMLQKISARTSNPNSVACNVTFKRNGPVTTFESSDAPKIIRAAADRDAIHSEKADVKVVERIKFCRGDRDEFAGCAWPPQDNSRSIIVVRDPPVPAPALLWAHEFGHRMGLRHRGEPRALMTVCDLKRNQVQVTRKECKCFLDGPGSCTPAQEPPNPDCGN
jgi:hypothetical protein